MKKFKNLWVLVLVFSMIFLNVAFSAGEASEIKVTGGFFNALGTEIGVMEGQDGICAKAEVEFSYGTKDITASLKLLRAQKLAYSVKENVEILSDNTADISMALPISVKSGDEISLHLEKGKVYATVKGTEING